MVKNKGSKKQSLFKRVLKTLFIYIPLGFIAITVLWVTLLKWVPVYFTPLMIIRSVENIGNKDFTTYKTWKPLSSISPNLAMAVMASEDTRFLQHNGFDWVEIDNAIDEKSRGKRMRGASTISQQTAKNVFLIPSKSWIRKGFEAYFTLLIELIWGKERIMEVYLNVAEMGKGIYGAEAAAEQLFQTRASKLSGRQSAAIAACLPNPIKRRANALTPYLNRRTSDIQNMMNLIPRPDWLKKKTAQN